MTTKQRLHQLVDELPETEIYVATRLMEALKQTADPLLHALRNAPIDDEPTTPEEDAGAAEAWQEYLRGESISAEEAKRRLLS